MRAYFFEQAAHEREVTIERFGGVDYGAHPTKTDFGRSPDACNMIAEETDFLVKRPGYTRIADAGGHIYGLFALPGEEGSAAVHAGDTLYVMDAAGTLAKLIGGMNQAYSYGFMMSGALYLLDGKIYRKVYRQGSDWKVKAVKEEAFVRQPPSPPRRPAAEQAMRRLICSRQSASIPLSATARRHSFISMSRILMRRLFPRWSAGRR